MLGHYADALAIFDTVYVHMLECQEKCSRRIHKAMPLYLTSICYLDMGCRALAKRYIMLNLCEDAVSDKGELSRSKSGSYRCLLWEYGLTDAEVQKYAKDAFQHYGSNSQLGMYPEFLLQQLGNDWITELPSGNEAIIYRANTKYVRKLVGQLGDGSGKPLERLAHYLLSCMPGCRATPGQWTPSTEYDIVCAVDGLELDFRSEFGRCFLCECKDWTNDRKVDTTVMAKFCYFLSSVKSRFGIIFSQFGVTGAGETENAEREQVKVFQNLGIVIVSVDKTDIEYVADGGNFVNLLRRKYERIRLDLRHKSDNCGNK